MTINIDALIENADWPKRTQDVKPWGTRAKYSPTQPRDRLGRWTTTAGIPVMEPDEGSWEDEPTAGNHPEGYGQRWDGVTIGSGVEANKFLAQWHPETNWGVATIDSSMADAATRQIDKLWDEHPEVGATVRLLEVSPVAPDLRNAYGFWDSDAHTITLNYTYFRNGQLMNDARKEDVERGWAPEGAHEPEWSITHEFGHAYDTWSHQFRTFDNFLVDDYISPHHISGYGDKRLNQGNYKEQFADAFAAWQLGTPTSNKYVAAVGREVGSREAGAREGMKGAADE